MSVLTIINLIATFAVFSAVCVRLRRTAAPGHSMACRGQWLLWAAAHIGVALAMLLVLVAQYGSPRFPGWHIILFKVCLAVLFLMPWRNRRRGDR